jgi:hypothetical protein
MQQQIDKLARTLYQHGAFDSDGRRALKRLAQSGAPAVDSMLALSSVRRRRA